MFGFLMGCWMLAMGVASRFLFSTDRAVFTTVIGCVACVEALLLVGGMNLCLVARLSRLSADRNALIFVTRLGVRQKFPRVALTQIVRRSFDVTVRTSYTFSYFVVVGANGRALFKLSQKWWPDEGVVAVGRALQLPITGSFFDVVDGPTFRREYPGSIPWLIAHPRLAALGVGLLFLPVTAGVLELAAFIVSVLRGTQF